MPNIRTKYKGYCDRCHFTIWKGEAVDHSKQTVHRNCVEALRDPTPRRMNTEYRGIYGSVDRKRFADLLEYESSK